jgi:hypothetical protein
MDDEVEVGALAINVVIPEHLRWRDERRGEEYELQSLTVRLLPDGHLAVKAYGRPVVGGRGVYTAFRVPEGRPELTRLVEAAASRAAERWAAHRGLG